MLHTSMVWGRSPLRPFLFLMPSPISCLEDSSELTSSSSFLATWFQASSSSRLKKINFHTQIFTVGESNVFTPLCFSSWSSYWAWPSKFMKNECWLWLQKLWPPQQSSEPTFKLWHMKRMNSTLMSNRIHCSICGCWVLKNNFTSFGLALSHFCFIGPAFQPPCCSAFSPSARSFLESSWCTKIQSSHFTFQSADSGKCPSADWSSIWASQSTTNFFQTSCQLSEQSQS